jgi:flagellar assembly protein FliH
MAELSAAIDEHRRAAKQMAAGALALSDALDQLERADLGRIHDVEQQVLKLALGLAEEIIGHEVDTSDDAVLAAATRSLALAPDRGAIVLRVHPADVAVVREALDGTRDTAQNTARDSPQNAADSIAAHLSSTVQVIADPSIERAGAVAEAGPLRIDAQVSSALARIRDAFAT